jgi:methyl coenzyme M reductase subunit C
MAELVMVLKSLVKIYHKSMDEDEKKEIAEDLGLEPEEVENIEEDALKLMKDHDIDEDVAEKAQELIDEGIDEDDAVEIAENIL